MLPSVVISASIAFLFYRQKHEALFGKSDLSFICMMRPLSFDIQKQDLEIEAAQVCLSSIL